MLFNKVTDNATPLAMSSSLGRLIGKFRLKRGVGLLSKAFLERPYTSKYSRRIICYYTEMAISYSQVYPFIYYEKEIQQKYDCELRFQPIDKLFDPREPVARNIDIALVQPWFDVPPNQLVRSLEELKKSSPGIEVNFLDSFAHNDLRLARAVDPFITHYVKKSLFVNRQDFLRPYKGDTNLTEYYCDLFGLQAEFADWNVPASILPKLKLCPNFFTAPHLIGNFERLALMNQATRKTDVHARLGTRGSNWYQKMRESCNSKIRGIKNISVISGGGVRFGDFIRELRSSKICLSPFGYGELCWRDIEAFMTGAVLVKPDMAHLDTLPELYEPNITYLPVKWDFSDMEDVIRSALSDESRRERIANEAFRRVQMYIQNKQFVLDMAYLFR